jgi:hypothetical protein
MPLSLQSAAAVVRRDARPREPDAVLDAYHRELLAPYGIEADEELLKRSANIGFPELATDALAALPEPIKDPDLLILSYGLPDRYPLKSTTSTLNYILGGGSRSFAVCEQGLHAPFTALKVGDAFARSGRCSSLALFICEQTTLPYYDPIVHDTPLTDSAALLCFGAGEGWQFRHSRVAAPGESLGPAVAALLDDLPDDLPDDYAETPALVVAGPWVSCDALDDVDAPVHCVAPGSYCTSVWLDLARNHQSWAEAYDALVLCDTDPRTGRSQAALIRKAP